MSASQPPGPPVPVGVEMPCRFTPGPADMMAQKVVLGGTPVVALTTVTPSTALTTFWSEDAFRAKLQELTELFTGIEVAPAHVLQFPGNKPS